MFALPAKPDLGGLIEMSALSQAHPDVANKSRLRPGRRQVSPPTGRIDGGSVSFASAPVRRKQATRDLTLKIISDTAAPQSDELCDFSLDLPLPRVIRSLKESGKDAPQPVHDPTVLRMGITNVRS